MKKQIFWLFFAALGLCTACTVEKETAGTSADGGKELQDVRHEVLLTFKNKLVIPGKETKTTGTTKAGDTPLATTQENSVTALDVYVFASDSETGNYTFQERFAYRQNEDGFPAGSKELTLESGSKENEFTALLSLQKGLFVKLYCIANQPLLVDPANEGNAVADTYFQPLVQTTPGQAGSRVATEGVPSESLFQSFHTPLLQETSAADTLVCPLPMSGAYTQPLDLTDYSVSSRMQVGFKLTRAVARFDLINNAALSRFTIDSIGMSNGRKAVTFFPIQAYGDQPTAQPDELITYPLRAFSGDKANTGTQTGAFYAYPSLPADETGLILKGRYKINETETKATSYPVAFKQTDAQGNGAFIEINPNHRYTIAITQADEYKLQTNIITSDWADDGSIDEYNPGETNGEVAITIPAGFTGKSQWDASTRTASMSLDAGSSLDVSIPTNSAVVVSKRYSGRDQSYDWLEVSAPTVAQTKAFTAFGYQYTLSLKDGYTKNRYPKATLRFTDAVTGEESIVFVEAVASPELVEIPKVPGDMNLNSMDIDTQTASVFRTTGSNLQIKFFCPNGVDMESAPSWLKVEKTKEEGTETTFTLTLLDRDVADTEGMVVFHNSKKPDNLKTDITVQLQDASLTPAFNSLGGDGNVFTAAHDGVLDDIQMPVKEGNTFAIGITSILGVEVAIDFDRGSEWLKHNGEMYMPSVSAPARVVSAKDATIKDSDAQGTANSNAPLQTSGIASINRYAGNKKNTVTFSLDNNNLSEGKKATVTLKNKTGGKDYLFTVTPKYSIPVVSLQSSVPVNDKLENTAFTLYKLPATVSTFTLKVVSLGGSKLEYTGSGLTLPASMESIDKEATYTFTVTDTITGGKLKIMNYADHALYREYTVTAVKSDITVTADATFGINLTNNRTGSRTGVSSPLGFTASNTSINWGSGGIAWFDLTTTDEAGGSGKSVGIRVKSNLTSLDASKVQTATITLTNKIANGGNATFTVTPVWLAPANASGQLTSFHVNAGTSTEIRLVTPVPFGVKVTSNATGIATYQSLDSSTGIVTINGVGAGNTIVKVSSRDDKTVLSYTVAVKTIPSSSYITITNGGMTRKWAVGNLVAQGSNSCTIGSAADKGLMFRWGSLVGYDVTTTGNPTSPVVKPNAYSNSLGFAASPYVTDANIPSTPSSSTGQGDPCHYYLGGNWRLPTADEYRNNLGGGVSNTTVFKVWGWVTSPTNGVYTGPGKQIFFPVAGYRYNNGNLNNSSTLGCIWSSTPFGNSTAYGLNFSASGPYIDTSYTRSDGRTVRCVQE